MQSVRIIVVGEYQEDRESHQATNRALDHAAESLGVEVDAEWISSLHFCDPQLIQELGAFHGLWIAPGSPYLSLTGALNSIQLGRERQIPLLRTCGGFQHIVLEFARNVLNLADAGHQEYGESEKMFISRLDCSVFGQSLEIHLEAGSLAARLCESHSITERYYCNFGVNPEFAAVVAASGLRVTGTDLGGEIRIVELPDHPFFLGTLFLPQLRSELGNPHPIVKGFCATAVRVIEQR